MAGRAQIISNEFCASFDEIKRPLARSSFSGFRSGGEFRSVTSFGRLAIAGNRIRADKSFDFSLALRRETDTSGPVRRAIFLADKKISPLGE